MATERDTSNSWWSNHHHHTSNHLLELQKEIKEEEEEIFADINSLINNHSNLYSNSNDCDDDDHAKVDEENFLPTYPKAPLTKTETTLAPKTQITATPKPIDIPSTTTSSTATTRTINNNIHISRSSYKSRLDERLFYSDDADEEEDDEEDLIPDRYKSRGANNRTKPTRGFHSNSTTAYDDDEETNRDMDHFHIDSGPPPQEVDFMHQDPYPEGGHHHDIGKHEIDDDSDYLADHKYNANNQISQQNYQAFQAVIQHVTSNLPKPCVFFLEGNCRRSDCKYSHDLSNITCKYWIEGFCFKGEMCPFLHSYNPPLDPSDPNCFDEDGLNLLSNKELNPTFAIESEADFPSLPLDAPASALNDSTKSSNNADSLTTTIKDQILSSNPAVVFKTVKKKRKRG